MGQSLLEFNIAGNRKHSLFSKIKLCSRNCLEDIYPCAKFHCNIFMGRFPPNMWNITLLWLFYCPVLSCPVLVILLFSQLCPGRTPGHILTIYGLNDASSPEDVRFEVWMTTHNIKTFKTSQKTPQGGMVKHFPAKLTKLIQNCYMSGGEYRIDTKFRQGK